MTAMEWGGGEGAHSIEIRGMRKKVVALKNGGIYTHCTLWPQELRDKNRDLLVFDSFVYWPLISPFQKNQPDNLDRQIIKYEEEQAIKRDSASDLFEFQETCENIEKIVTEMNDMKQSGVSSEVSILIVSIEHSYSWFVFHDSV